MNDITAIKLLMNFMQKVNVTGVEEAQALLQVNNWLIDKEKQIIDALNQSNSSDQSETK